MSKNTNAVAEKTKGHSKQCFCSLCVPSWNALPQSDTENSAVNTIDISLTEWAERGAELIARDR